MSAVYLEYPGFKFWSYGRNLRLCQQRKEDNRAFVLQQKICDLKQ